MLLRGVRFLDEEQVWVVQVGRFRGRIDVEDTPFWITAFDCEVGTILLTDGTTEPLSPETLTLDPDGVLRCVVKKARFPARFTRAGQAHLLDALERSRGGWMLRIGACAVAVPGLPADP